MATLSLPQVLDTALRCFVKQGLQATTVDELTTALGCSHRKLYQLFPSKAALLEAVYAQAVRELLAGDPVPAHKGERLQQHLGRWWQRTAEAAHAHPQAFAFWALYRAQPTLTAPVLGPFAALPDLLTRVLARRGGYAPTAALSPRLLSRLLAAQWTALVEVLLTDAACQANLALRLRLLQQGFGSWWTGTGLAAATPTELAPASAATNPLLELVGRVLVQKFLPPGSQA